MNGREEGIANFVFGDSLVDAGNNNYIMSLSKANYAPNGVDFGMPTGRYTNGRTIVDIIGKRISRGDIWRQPQGLEAGTRRISPAQSLSARADIAVACYLTAVVNGPCKRPVIRSGRYSEVGDCIKHLRMGDCRTRDRGR